MADAALIAMADAANAQQLVMVPIVEVAGPALGADAQTVLRDLQARFKVCVEIVPGGVHERAQDMDVVVCPCKRDLENLGIGAQDAVRRAAGSATEAEIEALLGPLPEMGVQLVGGGALAKHVAMTVTEPPRAVFEELQGEAGLRIDTMLDFLVQLHSNLFQTVRDANLRSIAMPTLCTGGFRHFRMPTSAVAIAALEALRKDFYEHPRDPLRVRVACFEPEHVTIFNAERDELLEHLSTPDVFWSKRTEELRQSMLTSTSTD